MTIEAQIKALEYLKKCGIFPFSDTRTGIVFDDECIDGAIDTMRKYQRIEQILKDIPYGGDVTVRRIQEVVEDGKVD